MPDLEAEELDDEVRYDQRNFFARGGEVYYLILSIGTRHRPEERKRIEKGIRNLVTGRNQAIGQLAEIIEDTWEKLYQSETEGNDSGTLGWIPEANEPFYKSIADDVETFLEADLDALEALSLFAHLICFHLSLHVYKRAEQVLETLRADESDEVASPFLIDLITAAKGDNTLRRVSASLFKAREDEIEKSGTAFVEAKVNEWQRQSSATELPEIIKDVDKRSTSYFGLSRLRSKDDYETEVESLIEDAQRNQVDASDLRSRFTLALTKLLMNDFGKNFLPVHRKLTKAIRFVAPQRGPSARFVLGDDLLKAVTLSNVSREMTFDRYLDRLYDRYDIVIGARHARDSGLFDQQRINSEYYDQNREVMLERMKHAGLAQEFSDATAMIRPLRA